MRSGLPAVAASFVLFCTLIPALAAPAEKTALLKGAYRFERAHWIYVHLEGTPERIGFQHGYLLAPEIEDAFHAAQLDNTHSTGRPWLFFRDTAKNIYWPRIEAQYREELQGIANGVKAHGVHDIDLWDVVALNAFLETPQYYVPWLDSKKKAAKTDPPAHGNCSAFVATGDWTRDHHPVIAHSMWYPFMTGEYWRVVFDIVPEHGYRILMDGFPGKIDSGDDFGMNSAGIAITETTITGFLGFDPKAVPEFVRARKAMQYAASIDDFARIMFEGDNGGYANDWLIVDNKANEVARFELGLKVHHLWRTKNGFFVGSNFPSDPELIKQETDFNPNNPASSMNARHKRWDQLMDRDKGSIDAPLAQKFLADHFDAYENKEDADERTLCGHTDASSRGVPEWGSLPYSADGAVNAKAADGEMIRRLSFFARSGRPCGEDFLAHEFLSAHPNFNWQEPELRDMKGNPWTIFRSGDHGQESPARTGN
ncbi:MAG TPA: C45 family peptidase [Terracidiphilus sp.]|nr:C45 family peptidase [Terracidiphilus sp.]